METKITIHTSVDAGRNINEEGTHVIYKRLYTAPQICRLVDVKIESGTTTNLAESTGGVWAAGS